MPNPNNNITSSRTTDGITIQRNDAARLRELWFTAHEHGPLLFTEEPLEVLSVRSNLRPSILRDLSNTVVFSAAEGETHGIRTIGDLLYSLPYLSQMGFKQRRQALIVNALLEYSAVCTAVVDLLDTKQRNLLGAVYSDDLVMYARTISNLYI